MPATIPASLPVFTSSVKAGKSLQSFRKSETCSVYVQVYRLRCPCFPFHSAHLSLFTSCFIIFCSAVIQNNTRLRLKKNLWPIKHQKMFSLLNINRHSGGLWLLFVFYFLHPRKWPKEESFKFKSSSELQVEHFNLLNFYFCANGCWVRCYKHN